ncbi:MAG TPA: bile acid:sodium symporter family protein [Bacteroidales bacterium]|nr:bile acid:sodium symporter family protein [Bacteroidales bacterium]
MGEALQVLDGIRLNFSRDGFFFLNIILALIMFGVALEIKPANFKIIVTNPKPVIVGFLAQHILVPAVTFLLVLLLHPTPSIALGMILVAACPGGNISNFLSLMAKGNVELSVTLTALSTILAVVMTPFNFALYGSLYSGASHLLVPITIDPVEMVQTVSLLLGIPLVVGMFCAWRFPNFSQKLNKPMRIFSLIVFAIFVFAALAANFSYFLRYIHLIFLIVLIQNASAFLTGHYAAKLFRLGNNDVKTIGIESGIHNSGLALVLIFNPKLFDGLGGMAFIAAWWGIWHIIAGMGLATFYSKKLKNNSLKD